FHSTTPNTKTGWLPPASLEPAMKTFIHAALLIALTAGLVVSWLKAGAAQQRGRGLEAELKKEPLAREDEVTLCLEEVRRTNQRMFQLEGLVAPRIQKN